MQNSVEMIASSTRITQRLTEMGSGRMISLWRTRWFHYHVIQNGIFSMEELRKLKDLV